MKFITFIASLVSLQVIQNVSSQPLSEMIFELIVLNENKRSGAETEITLQQEQTRTELKRQLKQKVAPSLVEVNKEVEEYVKKMTNETTSAGYNTTSCVGLFEEALTSEFVPNITNKAVTEMTVVHEPLLTQIRRTALHNLRVIASEVDTITNDYALCLNSGTPEYCNGTLTTKLLSKQEELPLLYNKEVHRTTIAFIEQVVNYENRAQDYVLEAVAAIKPYLNLMESCVSGIISLRK